jgi:hypothetical protein
MAVAGVGAGVPQRIRPVAAFGARRGGRSDPLSTVQDAFFPSPVESIVCMLGTLAPPLLMPQLGIPDGDRPRGVFHVRGSS